MKTNSTTFVLAMATIAWIICAGKALGQLVLTTAGNSNRDIATLLQENSLTVCKDDYPEGLNVRCDGNSNDEKAEFIVNGRKYRTEQAMPYYLAGDVGGVPERWTDIPNTANLVCITESVTYQSTIIFSCLRSSQNPIPNPTLASSPPALPLPPLLPGMMYAVAAGRKIATSAVMINSGSKICSRTQLGTKAFSVVCGGDRGIKWARFAVNGVIVQQDKNAPYSITKSWKLGKFAPWREAPLKPFNITCILSNGFQNTVSDIQFMCSQKQEPNTSPTASPTVGGPQSSGCVNIQTRSAQESGDWIRLTDGMVYRPGNFSTSVSKPGIAPLQYKFTVQNLSRYAVVVDITSFDEQNYNDIWLSLAPGGLQLKSPTQNEHVEDWVKVFHRENGRSVTSRARASFVGSLSSGEILIPGREYTVFISGRSTRVVVHEIVLFPCPESKCHQAAWTSIQQLCLPSSA